MATSPDATMLLVGNSRGRIMIFDVSRFAITEEWTAEDYERSVQMKNHWRAHITPVTSVSYAGGRDLILTASKDATIRVWTIDGAHVGIFGQHATWELGNPATYMPIPADVRGENQIENKRRAAEEARLMKLKKITIGRWKNEKVKVLNLDDIQLMASAAAAEPNENDEDVAARVKQIRRQAISKQTFAKWRSFVARQKAARSWREGVELDTTSGSRKFFTLDLQRRHRPLKPRKSVNSNAVYHTLDYYPLGDCKMPTKPACMSTSRIHGRTSNASLYAVVMEKTRREVSPRVSGIGSSATSAALGAFASGPAVTAADSSGATGASSVGKASRWSQLRKVATHTPVDLRFTETHSGRP